jgi:hypothetical protein
MMPFGAFAQPASANFKPNLSPDLLVLSPSQNTVYNSPDVPLNVTIQLFGYYQGGITAEALNWLNYSLDGHEGSEISIISLPNAYWPTPVLNGTGSVMLSNLSEGRHWIEVRGETSFNATFSTGLIFFTVDSVLPAISVLPMPSEIYSSENASLSFTLNEQPSWVAYSLDDEANVTINGNTSLPKLSDGVHSIIVYANDTTGNMGASQTIDFAVTNNEKTQTPEPFPTLLVFAASVAVAAIVAVAALVYLKKRKREAQLI